MRKQLPPVVIALVVLVVLAIVGGVYYTALARGPEAYTKNRPQPGSAVPPLGVRRPSGPLSGSVPSQKPGP
jgi:hypothetical protein